MAVPATPNSHISRAEKCHTFFLVGTPPPMSHRVTFLPVTAPLRGNLIQNPAYSGGYPPEYAGFWIKWPLEIIKLPPKTFPEVMRRGELFRWLLTALACDNRTTSTLGILGNAQLLAFFRRKNDEMAGFSTVQLRL